MLLPERTVPTTQEKRSVLYVENVKRAVVVGLGVRYEKGDHELYPVYGWLYEQGYLFATRGEEDFYVLTEPLPETVDHLLDVGFANEEDNLKALGYELSYLVLDEEGNLKLTDRL